MYASFGVKIDPHLKSSKRYHACINEIVRCNYADVGIEGAMPLLLNDVESLLAKTELGGFKLVPREDTHFMLYMLISGVKFVLPGAGVMLHSPRINQDINLLCIPSAEADVH